ncbi:hypothetical protein BGZ61DRAFT_454056 [Ilyonectria robusta]|uniref:uncharacterized protein n=1 Tax=Ilyonectria robusta TaxID=1079257 RepID=UPI001E8D6E6B|nr:uncharacterized protein BGZ61DRAFT_454056 [Ilyonectria robusta]KAH8687010.1 hypothetical protein BGZ61DRAFT_454056 [Ilyonectria robusta]
MFSAKKRASMTWGSSSTCFTPCAGLKIDLDLPSRRAHRGPGDSPTGSGADIPAPALGKSWLTIGITLLMRLRINEAVIGAWPHLSDSQPTGSLTLNIIHSTQWYREINRPELEQSGSNWVSLPSSHKLLSDQTSLHSCPKMAGSHGGRGGPEPRDVSRACLWSRNPRC